MKINESFKQDSTHLIAVVSRIGHKRTPLPFNKSGCFLCGGECMSHLIVSLFKYKLKLMRVDRHIMHWIMLNWTSLNNTYCQTVYNPVEMFISALLGSFTMASSVNELTKLSLAIWWSLSDTHFFICLFCFGFSVSLYQAHFNLRRVLRII